jgi:hypothetical protein
MSKLNVKNGTPIGSTQLCRSCDWGQFIVGYRESDLLVICNNTSPNIVVPFAVYECSGYHDKHRPSYDEMKKLAINIAPVRVSARTAGFASTAPLQPDADTESQETQDSDDEQILVP